MHSYPATQKRGIGEISRQIDFTYFVLQGRGKIRRQWSGRDTSLAAFPVAYEVFYELFNTTLIERLRDRRKTRFPSKAQMKALNDGCTTRR